MPEAENPTPVHAFASVDDHDSVADDPDEIDVGLAVSVAVGIGADAVTVTVALLAGDVPLAPVHVTEYVVVTLGETETEPEVPLAVKPVPVQDVALVEDQVRVEEFPETTEVGLAESEAVGFEPDVPGTSSKYIHDAWSPEDGVSVDMVTVDPAVGVTEFCWMTAAVI